MKIEEIQLTPEIYERLDAYREKHNHPTCGGAIWDILEKLSKIEELVDNPSYADYGSQSFNYINLGELDEILDPNINPIKKHHASTIGMSKQ